LIDAGFLRLVEDLAMVQRLTGTFFPMLPQFSPEDLDALGEAVDLLNGTEVTRSWNEASFELVVADPNTVLNELSSKADGASFYVEGQTAVRIGGHVLPLGKTRTYFPEARIANLEEIEKAAAAAAAAADLGDDLTVPVKLEALGTRTLTRSLVS
jgi:hypothetical protein